MSGMVEKEAFHLLKDIRIFMGSCTVILLRGIFKETGIIRLVLIWILKRRMFGRP